MRPRPALSFAATILSLLILALPTPAVAQEAPATTASAAVEGSTSEAEVAVADSGAAETEEDKPLLARFNAFMFEALFFDVTGGAVQVPDQTFDDQPVLDPATGQPKMKTITFPFLVMVLMLGAVFFTFWYRFINLRAFKHAIDIVRGLYDDPDDEGEISHFRALTSALSATVGLGNIAGVAVAIVKGGPGAVVWMMILAVFGMTAKFSSCCLAQLYRKVNADGSISGGPMYYLDIGLKSINPGVGVLGKVLAVVYAFMIMGGAFGGGNMFQS
ncbi:MAG: sodium:alanine symporter family protein, partial [Myxococcales bacterium]|nr:sodium:alanine symporter family protein [Myxococcales bacterium]